MDSLNYSKATGIEASGMQTVSDNNEGERTSFNESNASASVSLIAESIACASSSCDDVGTNIIDLDPLEALNAERKESLYPCDDKFSCEMCRNYEQLLTKLQDSERTLKEQLTAAQHLADRYQIELAGERLFRNELDTKISTLSSEANREAKAVEMYNEENRQKLLKIEERYEKLYQLQRNKLRSLRDKLRLIDNEMQRLGRKYINLCGVNRNCSTAMKAQAIELPQDVDQLQFFCLQLREELIETRAAKEHLESELRDEITMLEVQRREDQIAKNQLAQSLTDQVNGVSEELGLARSELICLRSVSERAGELEKQIADSRSIIQDLDKQIKTIQLDRSELESALATYKRNKVSNFRCMVLQQELDTSEAVQKDFVTLSQNLQMELEKIRQAGQEVRWQFDDDVFICNQCQDPFTKTRGKLHCQHCGRIFCSTCLAYSISSGPNRRLAKVCHVCHTLLSKESAPFFSQTIHD